MPKILINEENNTSAGTPGRYGNYSVLIAGYMGTPSQDQDKWQKPDENGVYEFNSTQAFLDTIGESAVEKKDSQEKIIEYHYGNRMAYHLLNLGYTVIYKVIDSVSDMENGNFWEIFKDKASYDFRFVSHGLLEACYDATAYAALEKRLEVIDEANNILAKIEADVDTMAETNSTLDKPLALQTAFTELEDKSCFVDNAGLAFATYAAAKEGLATDAAATKNEIKDLDRSQFTITRFNNINGHIAKLASYRKDDTAAIPGRGDCIALIELDETAYLKTSGSDRPETLIIEGINNMSSSIGEEGAYCALTVPSVHYKMNNKAVKFPGAFHYLACFMSSLRSGFAEWYAAAGYTRGVASYIIDHTSVKLGEIAINALEPRNKVDDSAKIQPARACNVIANFRGSYYLWGNRTAALLGAAAGGEDLTAEHFLNIRQLCSTIKKQLYVACRRFTFDPNSDTLWINFVNAITPTLDEMKADQGIRDYKVVKEFTDKKATLKARIRIIPIEAVEDFDITVSLEDSFGGVSVTAD
jgi:hypothetical protein